MEAAYKAGIVVQPRPGAIPRLKRYLDEQEGKPLDDVWTDIPPINSQAQERLGYPTQKPVALMERVIEASTNPGGIVLDPFGGCGTAAHAAQKTGRQWTAIDITYLAINLIKRRLRDAFGEELEFEEKGQPTDFRSAQRLAESTSSNSSIGRSRSSAPARSRKATAKARIAAWTACSISTSARTSAASSSSRSKAAA